VDWRTRRATLDRRDKAIAASSGDRLDITGLVRLIAEGLPKLIDSCVETVVEVARSNSGPKMLTKIFTRHQVAR
jgi:hypothetical protein